MAFFLPNLKKYGQNWNRTSDTRIFRLGSSLPSVSLNGLESPNVGEVYRERLVFHCIAQVPIVVEIDLDSGHFLTTLSSEAKELLAVPDRYTTLAHELFHVNLALLSAELAEDLRKTRCDSEDDNLNEKLAIACENAFRLQFGEKPRFGHRSWEKAEHLVIYETLKGLLSLQQISQIAAYL